MVYIFSYKVNCEPLCLNWPPKDFSLSFGLEIGLDQVWLSYIEHVKNPPRHLTSLSSNICFPSDSLFNKHLDQVVISTCCKNVHMASVPEGLGLVENMAGHYYEHER